MTVKELSQLYYLQREIAQDEARLQRLAACQAAADEISAGLTKSRQEAGGNPPPGGQAEPSLGALQALVQQKHRRCLALCCQLERYIAGIEDSLTRQVFLLRFGQGLPWGAVAHRIGGGNTAETVRQMACRYLKKHGESLSHRSQTGMVH